MPLCSVETQHAFADVEQINDLCLLVLLYELFGKVSTYFSLFLVEMVFVFLK